MPAGRGDDVIAELGQHRDRDRADAAGGARDHHGPLFGVRPCFSSASTDSIAV